MRIIIYILLIGSLSSCSLFDNEDPVPAFILLDNPTLITEADQGANTHNIKDVWVFDGAEFLGIFPLPARVPVIVDGNEKNISVFAGIRNNGVNTSALRYPFFRAIEFNINPEPNEEISWPLTFRYSTSVKFDFIEEFEGTSIFVEDPNPTDGPGVPMDFDPSMALSGSNCGHIFLESDTSSFERSTFNSYLRSNNSGAATYLELDYKCDIPFLVGYITQRSNLITRDYNILIAPSEEWNKIYIDLSQFLSPIEIERYNIQIATTITESITPPANVYLDNMKLIHF